MCCILGTDGILYLPENKALMSFACWDTACGYFAFRGGTGWIRIKYRASESLNNAVSGEDLVGGGAEAKSIDVRSAKHLRMPLVVCCGSFAARQRRLEIVTISWKQDKVSRHQ